MANGEAGSAAEAAREAAWRLRAPAPRGFFSGGMVGVARGRPVLPPRPAFFQAVRLAPLPTVAAPAAKRPHVDQWPAHGSVSALVAPSRIGDGRSTLAKERAARTKAFDEWFALVRRFGAACDIGRRMSDPAAQRTALEEALYGKATTTLEKRGRALRDFVAFADMAGCDPAPVSIEAVLLYLHSMEKDGAAPTRALGLQEALGFALGYLQLDGAEETIKCRQVRGLVQKLLSAKGERHQAAPLPAAMVMRLEEMVATTPPCEDVVVGGTMLMCTHCRSRFGDLVRADVEPVLDVLEERLEGFIETKLLHHKMARVAPDLRLPVVGHAFGVSRVPWARNWLAARAALGVQATVETGLLPGLAPNGGFRQSRMATSEASEWLRAFARRQGVAPEIVRSISAHSMKATLLSWAAKFGLDGRTRRTLGGHVKAGDKSMSIYSRDLLAAPLRELNKVLRAVAVEEFLPDESRSRMFPASAPEPISPTEDAEDSSSDDSDSSSDGGALDTDEGLEFKNHKGGYVLNLASGKLHFETPEGGLVCGRPWPRSSKFLDHTDDVRDRVCAICANSCAGRRA